MNFKNEEFQGSLYDLLVDANEHLFKFKEFTRAVQEYVEDQLKLASNILPVRKHAGFEKRGEIRYPSGSDIGYISADNEPLAYLTNLWFRGQIIEDPLVKMFSNGSMVASWKCDIAPKPEGYRFGGVQTEFRRKGLKLAHILDAGRDLDSPSSTENEMSIRFLRSISPINVFLFPNKRSCNFEIKENPFDWVPQNSDWAEDVSLRSAVLGWFVSLWGEQIYLENNKFGQVIEINEKWEDFLKGTRVRIVPKIKDSVAIQQVQEILRRKVALKPLSVENAGACPSVSSDKALDIKSAVEVLRQWRKSHPNVERLDGKATTEGNRTKWLHIKVDGYSAIDSFKSWHGDSFNGSDYNGIVNFHGDAKVEAIDDFIELIDNCEDYKDVLQMSATYEFRSRPKKNPQIKPKFALQGYTNGVQGFYLYHDEWQANRQRRAA